MKQFIRPCSSVQKLFYLLVVNCSHQKNGSLYTSVTFKSDLGVLCCMRHVFIYLPVVQHTCHLLHILNIHKHSIGMSHLTVSNGSSCFNSRDESLAAANRKIYVVDGSEYITLSRSSRSHAAARNV
ncbi:hypothetical protein Bhyg_13895 [Pseudolycoriella hygida]|uniref:Uncharacterized protein n=1 Tax=Pseudolycoriella hygida TaxID=35572 RepID=A0A9Q0MQG7_9DIPT|nr:hypothetical protein Bhyg_13895 [Pseudolycoriella hygida]